MCLRTPYSRPFPRVAEVGPAPPDAELTDLLEHANATRSRVERDWSVVERAPDGGVIAVRHGRARKLMPGQFLVEDGALPAGPGKDLLVQLPRGSRTLQPGFYHCFSEGFVDANDLSPVVRLYFNVGACRAADLIRMVTAALNRYEIAFQLKVTTRRLDFGRTDNAVLYLTQDSFHIAALALQPVAALEQILSGDTPLFTKRLGHGIGFAEDPGAGDSFGTSRSKLVAAALVAARDGDGFPYPAFLHRLAEATAAARLDLGALYLNPGSEDIYELRPAAS
jgi:hypothetical protein